MAAKKTKKVTIEIDIKVLANLAAAADAISEIANASIIASDDPKVKALGKKKKR